MAGVSEWTIDSRRQVNFNVTPNSSPSLPQSKSTMARIDHEKFSVLIHRLYAVVSELEQMFPNRPFTPDGHMVGSIGECLVADAFNLELMPPSNKAYDAKDPSERRVEIKATQSTRVAFRSCPPFTIIIQIHKDGSFETCYNGPGKPIWDTFEGKVRPSNGQYSIALSRVRELDLLVPDDQRVLKLA